MNIIIVGAYPRSLVSFRGDLIREFIQAGHRVTAMAGPAPKKIVQEIKAIGAEFLPNPVYRNSVNPLKDIQTLISLYKIFRQLKPDIILAYTIKPVIWGGIAARLAGHAKFYGLITGLGFALKGKGKKRKLLGFLVTKLYGIALSKAQVVIFQNRDNENLFLELDIVSPNKCNIVDGSGVNISYFAQTPLPASDITFLLIARLLKEKCLWEYVEAARRVKKLYPGVVCNLLGPEDSSPDGVPLNEVQSWHDEGTIQYLGATDDVRPYLAACHVYVLPSYGEGLPRTVIEAMATGRPILTTDAPGCKEMVIPGQNGFLVPVRDVDALAERMVWFIEHRDQWERMGKKSREIAEERFDLRKINRQLMEIMGLEGAAKGGSRMKESGQNGSR